MIAGQSTRKHTVPDLLQARVVFCHLFYPIVFVALPFPFHEHLQPY